MDNRVVFHLSPCVCAFKLRANTCESDIRSMADSQYNCNPFVVVRPTDHGICHQDRIYVSDRSYDDMRATRAGCNPDGENTSLRQANIASAYSYMIIYSRMIIITSPPVRPRSDAYTRICACVRRSTRTLRSSMAEHMKLALLIGNGNLRARSQMTNWPC